MTPNHGGIPTAGADVVSPVLRTLVMFEHALFGVLVAVGFVRALLTGVTPWLVVAGTFALSTWYAMGARRVIRSPIAWLVVLTLVWAGLAALSPEFVWVAFALWLLAGHFLPLRWAAGYTVVVLLGVVLLPTRVTGTPTAAGVLGPTIGAAFALAISVAQQQLFREDRQRRALLASLLHAESETAALQDQLAAVQHQSGVLAERTRISRDIHDTIAQSFSSILLLARSGHTDPGRSLEQISAAAAAGLAQSRQVVHALAPPDLDSDGLTSAVGRLLSELATQTGVATELRTERDLPDLRPSIQIALLRTVQGALANVRMHSGVHRVVVTLDRTENAVRLDVVDDGTVFDARDWASTTPDSYALGGYGLRSTRARLRELGGAGDRVQTRCRNRALRIRPVGRTLRWALRWALRCRSGSCSSTITRSSGPVCGRCSTGRRGSTSPGKPGRARRRSPSSNTPAGCCALRPAARGWA